MLNLYDCFQDAFDAPIYSRVNYLTDAPPDVSEDIILRKDQEREVLKLIKKRGTILLLNGPSGSGKTFFARRLFYQARKYYNHLAWIEYGTDMMAAISTALMGSEYENDADKCFSAAISMLTRESHDTILFIDDVKESAVNDDVFLRITGLGITIVATSRCEKIPPYKSIAVRPLTSSECLQLFNQHYQRILEKKQISAVNEINSFLNNNTMAILFLAEVMRDDERFEDLLNQLKQKMYASEYSSNTNDCFIGTLIEYAKLSLAEERCLQNLALLISGEIPQAAISWLNLDNKMVDSLVIRGFINYNAANNSFYLHDLIRDYYERKGILQDIIDDCIMIICKSDVNDEGIHLKYRMDCLERMLHLSNPDCPQIAKGYLVLAADCFRINQFSQALHHCDNSMKYYQESYDSTMHLLCSIYEQYAVIYQRIGQLLHSSDYFEKAHAIASEFSEQEWYIITGIESSWGTVYCEMGELELALKLQEKAISRCGMLQDDNPEENIDLGELYLNLGMTYDAMDKYNEALDKYKKALNCWESSESEVDTATAHSNIACVLLELGQVDKALEKFFFSLRIEQSELGERDANTAISYLNIGSAYIINQQYDKANKYLKKALKVLLSVLGQENPDTARCYNNLGELYYYKKEYSKALGYHQRALSIRKHIRSLNKYDLAESMDNMCATYCALGELEKALESGLEALDIGINMHPKRYRLITNIQGHISCVYAKKNDRENFLNYAQSAISVQIARIGMDHYQTKEMLVYTEKNFNLLFPEQSFSTWLDSISI